MNQRIWPTALLTLLLGLASPTVALAQEDAAKAFEEGRKLWDAKDAAGALPRFRKAVDATGSPNARLYLARCLRETGDLVQAYEEMARTVRDARAKADSDERYAATRDAAAAELTLLEARVGRVVIALSEELAGATVTLNGTAVDAAKVGTPLAVAPGEVQVSAVKPGGAPTQQKVVVAAGALQTITLSAAAAPAPGSATATPAQQPPAADTDADGPGFGVVRGLGIGVAALGVGGFVTFAVGTVQANDAFSTLESTCPVGPCVDTESKDTISSGKTAEVIANVGLGVGIAGIVAGTFMLIFGGPSEPEQTAWEPTPNGLRLRF